MAHTASGNGNRLVIDIGGASTEVIIGHDFKPLLLNSLNIGCVTFLERYFVDEVINQANFDAAIEAAEQALSGIVEMYQKLGWEGAVGASGTVQAIQEILLSQGFDEELTLEKLTLIQQQAIRCQSIAQLDIKGLGQERRLVFVSGLAILMAIFKSLGVARMTLAGGALREGVLYPMINTMAHMDTREQTLKSLMIRYHIDCRHAEMVSQVALNCAGQLKDSWQLDEFEGLALLDSAALLHELGLLIEYKNYHHHGAYILDKSALPGFTRAQHKLVTALVSNHRGAIDEALIARQTMTSCRLTQRLTRILRVAVILSMRRLDEALPVIKVCGEGERLSLQLPDGWLAVHPLMKAELEAEAEEQKNAGWALLIKTSS